MKLGFFGVGHVGLINLCGFAELGFNVVGFDRFEVIETLKRKELPFYEPGLDELFKKNIAQIELHYTPEEFFEKIDVLFLCVATPTIGFETDFTQVVEAAKLISKYITRKIIIIGKSTVPAGGYDLFKNKVISENPSADFDLAFVPEFLREGSAVYDFFNCDRIVIGCEEKLRNRIEVIFQNIDCEKHFCSINSAEIIKQASNSFLAMKISFINLISDFCEKSNGNIVDVSKGIGLDKRIGTSHMHAGIGYGGSCLLKDISSLAGELARNKLDNKLLTEISSINENRLSRVINNLIENNTLDKNISIWGLAFKKNSDDLRNSQALVLIDELVKIVNKPLNCYDMHVSVDDLDFLGNKINFHKNIDASIKNADVLIVLNDSNVFASYDMEDVVKFMNDYPTVIDATNVIQPSPVLNSINYYSFGNYNNGRAI